MKENEKYYIVSVIKDCLIKKFEKYKPESNYMPFHHFLLGKDRMALFSFIHSLNTTFGTSIFEPVAKVLSVNNFKRVETQYSLGKKISSDAQKVIQSIMNQISTGADTHKEDEIERIRKVCQSGNFESIKTVKADLYLESKDNSIHIFDLKSAKPNYSNFKDFKRTLLEWVAIVLANNPEAQVNSYIAIPYNPYHPKPYERWTLKGMIDIKCELKVAEEFWDLLNGKNTYNDLLSCFEIAGIELRPVIDKVFSKFK